MSSSSSPCAACKFLRRKCTPECVFAPYFPADNAQRFANVHKVFGASNVAKILNEIAVEHREDAVNSLAYEAEARLRDPVYGCVGIISLMQHTLRDLQNNLETGKIELAQLVGPSAMNQLLQNPALQAQLHPAHNVPNQAAIGAFNMAQIMGMASGSGSGPGPQLSPFTITELQQQLQQQQFGAHLFHQQPQQNRGGALVIREPGQVQQHQHQHNQMQDQQRNKGKMVMQDQSEMMIHQQQALEAQQLAAAIQAREEQEIMRNLQQQELMRFHGDQFGQIQQQELMRFQHQQTLQNPNLNQIPNPYHAQQQQLEHQQTLLMLQPPQQQQGEPVLMLQQPQQPESDIELQQQQQAILQMQQQQQQGDVILQIEQQEQSQEQKLFQDHHHHLHHLQTPRNE